MMTRTGGFGLAVTAALFLAGCGLSDRSMGSIFERDRSSNAKCRYNQTRYADGSVACRSGRRYRCNDGRWKDLRKDCGQNTAAAEGCEFDGRSYASGNASCQSGTRYRCEDGAWTNRGGSCGGGATGRRCRYRDATVPSQATICRSGKTSRCENGTWRKLGTTCQ
jgi:hypothetical protein